MSDFGWCHYYPQTFKTLETCQLSRIAVTLESDRLGHHKGQERFWNES